MRTKTTIKALGVATLISVLVMSLSGCSQKQALTSVAWQQQLNLPSVQHSVEVAQSLSLNIDEISFDWVDQSRERVVPALLFKPAHQQKAKALIVFSHGLGGSKERYAYLGQYWASQGYASLHVQHDGSDRKVWRGNRLLLPFRLMDAADETEALARVQDVKFALDQILASKYAADFDQQNIMMAGHSYGANTSMLLSGAVVEQNGKLVSLKDDRIKAAILISAPPFYNDQPLDQVLAEVTIPTLHITTTEDEIKVPGYYSSPADRFELYYAMASSYKVLAVFSSGSHNIFSGWRRDGDTAPQQQVIKAATQALSSAFIEQVTTGDGRAMSLWAQQHQPVLSDFIRSDLVAVLN
jgi:dienelactone hydrolase